MENESLASVAAITRFVREVTGRDCPDEVVRHVEVRRETTTVKSCPVDYELRIGDRLLVVVTSESVDVLSGSRLEKVISEGRRARDDGKFNRFRLVVQTPNAAEDKEKLLRSFEARADGDASRITTLSRLVCADAPTRRRMALYWTLIRPVSGLIRRRLLAQIKRVAEA